MRKLVGKKANPKIFASLLQGLSPAPVKNMAAGIDPENLSLSAIKSEPASSKTRSPNKSPRFLPERAAEAVNDDIYAGFDVRVENGIFYAPPGYVAAELKKPKSERAPLINEYFAHLN